MPNTVDIYGEKATLDYLISKTLPTTEFIDDKIESLRSYAFSYQNYIQKIQLDNLQTLKGNSFYNCNNLKIILCPNLKTYASTSITDCSNLEILDCGLISSCQNLFKNWPKMKAIFLRNSEQVVTKGPTEYWQDLWGEVVYYVPSNLVNDYKIDSDWQILRDRIFSIDDYPVQYTSETISDSWSEIITKINNGTENYKIGDSKTLIVDGEEVTCRIIAKNVDTITGTSNTAKTTWIAYKPLGTSYWDSASSSAITYKDSIIRQFISETLISKFPSELINNIKSVDKISRIPNTNNDDVSSEKLFLFSLRELGLIGYEASGPMYSDFFSSPESRILANIVNNEYVGYRYWTRTGASNSNSALNVSAQGGIGSSSLATGYRILVGFCI